MSDSDSDDWLEKHKPVGFCGALDAGRRALSSRGGNVWIAMHAEPGLRSEVVLAWLDQAGDVETMKDRIQQLSAFLDAADDVWFSFGG
ncbi:MAG: hypothetical protein ACYC39_09325 [Thiobacillus sp.]|nr:MAG: hypothetical protein B7Y27_10885 [Hydrogenophilales bacterium 16-64-40]OZA32389.1 MAG: hypothetical protein B7X82_13095 [Hydrogenophilales bacterium 17-64-65]